MFVPEYLMLMFPHDGSGGSSVSLPKGCAARLCKETPPTTGRRAVFRWNICTIIRGRRHQGGVGANTPLFLLPKEQTRGWDSPRTVRTPFQLCSSLEFIWSGGRSGGSVCRAGSTCTGWPDEAGRRWDNSGLYCIGRMRDADA